MFSKPVCRLAIPAIVYLLALICSLAQAQSTDWPIPPSIPNIAATQPGKYDTAPNGLPSSVSAPFGNSYSNGM